MLLMVRAYISNIYDVGRPMLTYNIGLHMLTYRPTHADIQDYTC